MNVQLADAASYTVLATNSSGIVSNTAALTVVVPPGNQTNKVGSNITFTVSAASPQALSYRWQFKGVDIAGATGTSFTTNNVLLGSAGTYSVIVSNTAVAATYSVTLVVTAAPPVIVTPPAGATVTAGQPVTFSVAASGTGPFSYQWLKNNVNIPGGTGSSFNLLRTRAADAGSYTVSVMNSAGNALSAAAVLNVSAPPQPLAVPPPAAAPGRFLFSFIPVVGLTNTVLTNGSPGLAGWGVLTNVPPPATAGTITVSDAVASPGRFYRVMVMP
ncbi:MAG: immunoglobulin domain-containing protein [Verrucomicrobia bacterium]|nr:immunoglobulin domain-containing protein [Verrucomicrobiota bacterium]